MDKNLIPQIEDLYTWIHQHPSYEIVKPIPKQLKVIKRPLKSKLPSSKIIQKPIKKSNINEVKKSIKTTTNIHSTDDLRSKVPQTLYEKILMRYVYKSFSIHF